MEFKSITKSSYINEGLKTLRIAQRIETVEELKERLIINMNSDYSRQTCWSQIRKRYLDMDKDRIIHTPLVKLIDFADEKLNKELMYYRYIYEEPMARETVINYIYPRLLSEGSFKIRREDVVMFINRYINKYTEATIRKTASSIIKALSDFGLAVIKENAVLINFYETSLYSFLYGLYSEYSTGYNPANRFKILNPSLEHIRKKAHFHKLYLTKPALIQTYLNLAWEKNYLDYEPRGGLNQYVLKSKTLNGYVNNIMEESLYE